MTGQPITARHFLFGVVALAAEGLRCMQRVYITLGKPNAPSSCNFALLHN